MTEPARSSQSSLAAVVALVAALAGVTLVVFGIVRIIGSIETDTTPSTVAFVTTTSTTAGETMVTSTTATPITPTTDQTVPTTDTDGSATFATVADDTGRLSAEFPLVWDDVSGGGWSVDDETVGLSLSAAVDRDAWYSGWGTPGAFLGISEVALDVFTPEMGDFAGACRLSDAGSREYPGYTTVVQEWVECGDEGSQFTTALIWPSTFAWSGLVQIVTLDGTATALLDHVMATLSYQP